MGQTFLLVTLLSSSLLVKPLQAAPAIVENSENVDVYTRIAAVHKDNPVMLRELDIRRVINRNAMKCFTSSTDCFWSKSSDGTVYVPYTISSVFDNVQRSTILDAMKTFASETCVQFIPQTNEVDYVSIESDVGCYAYIGKIGGAQTVSLDVNGCVYNGVIQHELNHALGFVHEHTRSDRDLYVEIIWKYISENDVQNFEKQDTNNLGTPYDYSSVMHYSNYAFSNVTGMETIVPIPDRTVPIGQRQELSPIDIERINLLYNCYNKKSGPTELQLNGTLGTFTSPNYPSPYPVNANYLYLIHIPSGQVQLQFNSFNIQNTPSCSSDYIKVYDGSSTSSPVLLDKTCGSMSIPALTGSSSSLLVQFVTDATVTAPGFSASYSTITSGPTQILLTGASGTFTSPSYPSPYPNNANYVYLIQIPSGQVQLQFNSFNIQNTPSCSSDYIKVYDGSSTSSPVLLDKTCGSMSIPALTGSSSSILVQFVTDASVTAPGFIASYSTFTSGPTQILLTGASGTFTSPNYPSPYPKNANYVYLIQIPSGQVQLQFNSFNIQSTPSCSSDYIKVYDGSSTSSPVLLDKTCGSMSIPALTGSSSSVLVQFVTDASVTAPGFIASYSTFTSGPTQILLTGASGTFTSPNYPSPYPKNANYVYLIKIPSGQVQLQFNSFNIQSTPSCSGDYIKVYDGSSTSSPVLLDKTCGSMSIPALTGGSNSVLVQFVTDASVTAPGFSASYSTFTSGPTQILLTGASGTFTSPNYPSPYPKNANYVYLIQIPSGQVQLQFNSFNIQSTPSCSSDYIKVYDGSSTSSPVLLDKTCGSMSIPALTGSSSSILVQFVTDASVTAPGFIASYSTFTSGPTQILLTGASGTFTSPNYPSPYPKNANYVYLIKIPSGQVQLQFNTFNIQSTPSCSGDYIKVYDGSSTSSPVLLDKTCGSMSIPALTGGSNSVLVQFVTDASVTAPGFSASYSTFTSGPTQILLTGASGTFTSPNYPSPYPKNANYVYLIQIPSGQVQLQFNSFNIQNTPSCSSDYIKVYDGSSTSSPVLLDKTCGSMSIPALTGSSSSILVQFVTDASVTAPGFIASYSTFTSGPTQILLTGASGTFTSPNYPSPYPKNANYVYLIKIPSGQVQLQFNSFNIQSTPSCSGDYIKVYDGSSTSSPVLLDKTCGSMSIPALTGGSNSVLVQFVTDASVTAPGFSASYSTFTSGPTQILLTGASGTFTSPSYPSPYPNNANYVYLIQIPSGQVQLQFNSFNIQNTPSCSSDYIKVYDGSSTSSPVLLDKTCGNMSIPALTGSSSSILVQFVTDASVTAPGFIASYSTFTSGPTQILLTGASGTFTSPSYPSPYPNNANYVYLIQIPSGQVQLQFNSFNIQNTPSCTSDYIKVYDGSSTSSPVLRDKTCGSMSIPALTGSSSSVLVQFVTDASVTAPGFIASYSTFTSGPTQILLTGASGTFTSPNYPSPYPNNANYVYLIQIPSGQVQLQFNSFNIQNTPSCSSDYIKVYDGSSTSSPVLLDKTCGSTPIPTLTGRSSSMLVLFVTDASVTAPGFTTTYGTFTSTSTQVSLTGAFGTFSSPNFPLPYPNNVNYFYLIQIPTGQVQLQFNSFNILVTQGCSGDYIMVYDGSSKSAPVLLNKTCGSTPIPTLTGSSTSMLVQFVTDASATAPGFTASYSTFTSGPIQIVLTGSSGTFNSPNYPSPYPKNVNYQYLIQIPSGEVYVDFNTINIQTTPGCSGAYIKAYDGPTKSSPVLLDKTCGNLSILSLLGSSNLLLIEFVTDASVPTQGFSASYSSYGSGPTQLLMTGALGSLNSPNYPENYPVNTNSLILIQIPSGQIRLQFNSFNIQSTPECSGDYIKVYDGSTKSSPVLLDKTCGARTIPTVTSSGSSMLVEFVTDATGTTPGFTASYTTISSGPTQVQLMSASGTFTSPKYPSPYPINTNYVYLIKIPIGQVLLQFNIFHIQSNPGCANDYIKIYDGSSKSSPVLLDKQCGRIQVAPIVSSANTMMVEFVTDASGSAPGFLASFSTVQCGATLRNKTGTFTTPNYPSDYPINIDCLWVLRGPVGSKITLEIPDFKIKSNPNCSSDNLIIRDGASLALPAKMKYCSTLIPPPFTSSGNTLIVQFHSDGSEASTGFLANYKIV